MADVKFYKRLKHKNTQTMLLRSLTQLNTDAKLWPICKSTIVKEGSFRDVFRTQSNIYDGIF